MMLKIKRVPTVVSNYQKEEGSEAPRTVGGCGRNCLKACCIQGICFFLFCYHQHVLLFSLFICGFVFLVDAKLPLYAFKKINKVGGKDLVAEKCQEELPLAFLDSLVLGEVIIEF